MSHHGINTKPAQINGGTDNKTVPTSKAKGQCAGSTPNTIAFIWHSCKQDKCQKKHLFGQFGSILPSNS